MSTMNSWEASALDFQYSKDGQPDTSQEVSAWHADPSASDSLIYPSLYCPSGFDMMSILAQVAARPNPQVSLGPIDASCAMLVCDLRQPDQPIVYVSEPFCTLTGYRADEVLGHNCRFLQGAPADAPGGKDEVKKESPRSRHVDREILRTMRKAVEHNTELQVEVVNFKKSGKRFVNLLSIIPIQWGGEEFIYSVGFLCEKEV